MTLLATHPIELPAFSGPLDLLLHLIERQELDITAISLLQVTQQYLEQVEKLKQGRIEHLMDFLVVAARLVLIKSRALLPQTPILPTTDEEEEDPAEALVRQLRLYKQFKESANWLKAREAAGLRTYLRVAPPPKLDGRLDLSGVTIHTLAKAFREALARIEHAENSVSLVRPRRITIEDQIKKLRHRLSSEKASRFDDLLSEQPSQLEVAVTLLAVLELIKRREVNVRQPELFGPIEIIPCPE